jgi:hypothetical protein
MTKEWVRRDKYLKKKYGISASDYEHMDRTQNFKCALCGKEPKPGKKLHVEHNHKTGKVRALACFYCNRRRIGQLNLEWAKKIYEYMVKYDG